jgi:hypothetical protein
MSIQLSKKQIAALKVELAQYGLNVTVAKPKRHNDWIAEREDLVRAVELKRQSAFWRTAQLRALKQRRKISPDYEAFITRAA